MRKRERERERERERDREKERDKEIVSVLGGVCAMQLQSSVEAQIGYCCHLAFL